MRSLCEGYVHCTGGGSHVKSRRISYTEREVIQRSWFYPSTFYRSIRTEIIEKKYAGKVADG